GLGEGVRKLLAQQEAVSARIEATQTCALRLAGEAAAVPRLPVREHLRLRVVDRVAGTEDVGQPDLAQCETGAPVGVTRRRLRREGLDPAPDLAAQVLRR